MGRALKAGLAYFALIFAAGFALGTLRVLVLLPRMGEAVAVALELPVMLGLSWLAAGALIGRFAVPAGAARLAMGGAAFGLLMAAEVGVSVFALGRDIAGHFGHWATLPGAAGLAGQVAFGLIPWARR
ncbi:hypothetical protein Ga0609869_000383 [Rhodovulum iodosum]|uniref:DUF4345 domain-containing protein n=1 Tax=Rhodovulum iodosum TaxID=68291 RepID=A0ABV3XQG3_9RHOB|nr:hypothetical protein [Rhodovulum robiginosum]RSK37971.1 hypothetical protein EJA01_03330 [Rhodovulum robiginosum]